MFFQNAYGSVMQDALSNLFLVALASTLLLGGCGLVENDGKADESTADSTFFRASLNEEEVWSGDPDAAISEQGKLDWLAVFADSTYEGQYFRERLSFALPFAGKGVYTMVEKEHETGDDYTRTSGGSFSTNDWDVVLTRYHPTADSAENQFTITSYDSTTGIITGTLRTTVVVDSADREAEPGEPSRRRPDTLHFADGEFRVKVRDLRDQ